jgi:hypothetical protein
MKARFLIFILLTALLGFAAEGRCGENGFSLGYGFAAFNQGRSGGKIEGGKDYNFVQATYLFEKPFSWKELALLVEPFSSYVTNPTSGVDLGVGVGLKYYPARTDKGGIYFMAEREWPIRLSVSRSKERTSFSSAREESASGTGTFSSRTGSAIIRTAERPGRTGRSTPTLFPSALTFERAKGT